jgi:acetylornithine deacetylase/succinyl-diaminopimelate desuccinylase-like protein
VPGWSLSEQLWEQAAMTIIGMDVPAVLGASNTIQASCRARISVRLPPDADADRCLGALRAAIEHRTPRELAVGVTPVSVQRGWRARTRSAAFVAAARSLSAAYGAECRTMGLGATVPFIHPFLAALDQPDCLLIGVGDPTSNAHAPDESVLLDDVRRAAIAEALLLGELAGHRDDARQ